MATTFHLFPFLPWELRARIWELTVEPRTVHVHAKRYYHKTKEDQERGPFNQRVYTRLISYTPLPRIQQTCRESRNLGLYQKALTKVEHIPEGGMRRYIWLNFDFDMLDIGRDDLSVYKSVAKSVKRLRLLAGVFDGRIVRYFNTFTNLTEARIFFYRACMETWYTSFVCFKLSCDRRNIVLIDEDNDRILTAQELYDEYKRQQLFTEKEIVGKLKYIATLGAADGMVPPLEQLYEQVGNEISEDDL